MYIWGYRLLIFFDNSSTSFTRTGFLILFNVSSELDSTARLKKQYPDFIARSKKASSFSARTLEPPMDAHFKFFGSHQIKKAYKPVMAGLNYFLTDQARGGDSPGLIGEKKDVKVWLSWLERYAHDEIGYLSTPIGNLPLYEDLKALFQKIIYKAYARGIYTKQFSLYVDHIIQRIELQQEAYTKEKNIPLILFDILARQKKELSALKEVHGSIVLPTIFTPMGTGGRLSE